MSHNYQHDPVAAMSESEATGEVAEIFADIRETMQLPLLTSIWRILAGVPNGLLPVWEATKPIFESCQADATLSRMLDQVELPIPEHDICSTLDYSTVDWMQIRGVIDVYNRSNSLNFLALSALDALPAATYSEYTVASVDVNFPALPPLLAEKDMDAAQWAFLYELNKFGATDDEPGLATVWRHLAHWPALLSQIHAGLAPLQLNGVIDQAKHQLLAFAAQEGARLAHLVSKDVEIPLSARTIVTKYVQHPGLVVRMVAIGQGLATWLRSEF